MYPNDGWKSDTEFQNDCLAYTLFHGQNRITSSDCGWDSYGMTKSAHSCHSVGIFYFLKDKQIVFVYSCIISLKKWESYGMTKSAHSCHSVGIFYFLKDKQIVFVYSCIISLKKWDSYGMTKDGWDSYGMTKLSIKNSELIA